MSGSLSARWRVMICVCLLLLLTTPLAGPPFKRQLKVVSEGKICSEGGGRWGSREPSCEGGLPPGDPHPPSLPGGIWELCHAPAPPAFCRINVRGLCDKEVKEDRPSRPECTMALGDRAEDGRGRRSGKCMLRPQVRSQLERSVCVHTRVLGTWRKNLFRPKLSPVQSPLGQDRCLPGRPRGHRPAGNSGPQVSICHQWRLWAQS